MPRKPKRPCSFPGCPELTDGRYCDMHQRQVDAYYNKYERDPQTRKRYGRRWRRIRGQIYLRASALRGVPKVRKAYTSRRGTSYYPFIQRRNQCRQQPYESVQTMSLIDHCPRRGAMGKTVGGSKSLVKQFCATGGGSRAKNRSFKRGISLVVANCALLV
jgi:hypothetical protein